MREDEEMMTSSDLHANGYDEVERATTSWAGSLPAAQGLYDPENEKDACGVGFMCQIKGKPSHKIVSDAKPLLCNMTHRGATGADARDGDGAGVMTGIPDAFFRREVLTDLRCELPEQGQYAVGNLFFDPRDDKARASHIAHFENLARDLHLRVLGWREVPVDNSILGPAALSKEPKILQPFVVLADHFGSSNSCENPTAPFDAQYFARQLYVLRKSATHAIGLPKWFYVCSLSNTNIIYKGQLSPRQVYDYYYDLNNVWYASHFALVHSRFSTNTFPSWDRAQPMRWAAHNGEINTIRGNKNWMHAREGQLRSETFKDELELLCPIVEAGGSDSAAFDNVLELLVINNVVTLPQAVMMMIPEAWQGNEDNMDPAKVAFYKWAACLMEPWDGPALFTFADGRYCGANLDRNGLRPCRYLITDEDVMVCASEVGAVTIDPARVIEKGRLQPGKMLLVDTVEGRVIDDKELKLTTSQRNDFGAWLEQQLLQLPEIVDTVRSCTRNSISAKLDESSLSNDPKLLAFGYTAEQISLLMLPMGAEGKEPLGSMGNDAPLACMTTAPRLIYDYFRQLFAQVTNPPIDPIREAVVMSLEQYVGPEGNILEMRADQCHRLHLESPILTIEECNALKRLELAHQDWKSRTLDITFDKGHGIDGYSNALDRICSEASRAIREDVRVLVLSDRAVNKDRVAISSLIAAGGLHHHLIRNKERSRVAIVVESGEAREVHHMCVLVGYGADAICPWLAQESIMKVAREGLLKVDLPVEKMLDNWRHAVDSGILKVMSKMGISTLASYKGAQIFEALGLAEDVINRCFVGTASRIQGSDFALLAMDALEFHDRGYPARETITVPGLPETGEYHWRDGGEAHINDPSSIANLQEAAREKNQAAWDNYSKSSHNAVKATALRGLLDFDFTKSRPIPIDQVEPWTEIVQRFATGAMSYGSISMEAHSALAIAMNRLGGKSNTGEGGEDAERSIPLPNGDSLRSKIKQIASGRFGVTSNYLADSDELQIKMAQGAKPGEGGELPGHKVSASIARTRHSTAGVGLISPPPHHDIYSIEDLKQLIYDLKCSNPRARISVKLVSEVGVGIVASGVAKAKADHILISGHDGGTGASRWTGIKYAGLPWELGLAEAHQTLVLNDLRGRVTVQTDGQLRTGRDVAMAFLLGAEECGFSTTALIAMGCIMMRKCHVNTCPVGIATQDPELRAKFAGMPEHVINFFYMLVEELRGIMAKLGLRTVNEMVGRSDLLKVDESLRTVKTAKLDLSPLLKPAWKMRPGAATYKVRQQDHRLYVRLDNKFIDEAEPALSQGLPVQIECDVVNTDRALGATLSYRVSKLYGEEGLPRDTIHINAKGSAGQSCGAFLAPGITFELEGDANDYVGKGMSGGRLIVYPPKNSQFKAEENIIVGNVCLYGATSGNAYFRGIAAERFAVRNSGAHAVVEGVGDHGCEYMTGGRIVILGTCGRNFAAGMSGGVAYVLDMYGDFAPKCNTEMVELGPVKDPHDIAELRNLIENHRHYTGSTIADHVIHEFHHLLPRFVRVMPLDYKRVLEEEAAKAAAEKKRNSHVDLLGTLSRHGSQVDVSISEERTELNRQQEKPAEPAVGDVEDAMIDDETAKARVPKLDKLRGFMKYKRLGEQYRAPTKRVKDFKELSVRLTDSELKQQTARCMDCGVPFCQSDTGCPISNVIPKWNDLVFKGQWKDALNRLLMTNNFPEFTGRVCPAPCEGACVLGITEQPVGIKSVEAAIIDKGWTEGWIKPQPPAVRTGKTVAVVGSGPAGLACADQLNRAGHSVTVYERADRLGGLLMYGIPNMKLDKGVVDRRIKLMADEGVQFVAGCNVGVDVDPAALRAQNDALVYATGATWPRDLPIEGREANGIHFAMEFLTQNTKSLLDSGLEDGRFISAQGKSVVVIGGGDTGNDCIGTSVRHGAKSVINLELLPRPPDERDSSCPWPMWPRIHRTDYGHTEVMDQWHADPRRFSTTTTRFEKDEEGNLVALHTQEVAWSKDKAGKWAMNKVEGTEQRIECQLVLLALGFLSPEKKAFEALNVDVDGRSNIKADDQKGKLPYKTNVEGVWACGDARRGQSLIVWGIQEGRACAAALDKELEGQTRLPWAGGIAKRDFQKYLKGVASGNQKLTSAQA
ncbi:putative glutamate synthase [Ceraceosorus guamensis]|uniref:Glutamate synthase [NADH] n=1 Tax=Ceraceosorus guamensis TaxID=1522189 RepID=A0A316VP63_9BASI|nr:putative glutamate synthase [Ceraceosorus guamensis]PWN39322.1 putative glutamate synthase [Ceraceosorus guamensis]